MVGGEPVSRHLAGIHHVGQADKHRVGQPMTAQIVPNPLDRIEFRTVRRQLQQRDISGYYKSLAAVPAGAIEDHHGMGIGSDLAADRAERLTENELSDFSRLWHDGCGKTIIEAQDVDQNHSAQV